MIEEKPFLIGFEKREVFQDHVNEEERKGENGGGGGLHIEAGKHKGQSNNATGIDGHEEMRIQVQASAIADRKEIEDVLRPQRIDEHAPPGEPNAREGQSR